VNELLATGVTSKKKCSDQAETRFLGVTEVGEPESGVLRFIRGHRRGERAAGHRRHLETKIVPIQFKFVFLGLIKLGR
jgi:hypothetical protein